tara:strand:- start:88 stop:585 length:498 start_codon:yes stop_codon:yes gene_type:complete
MSSRRRFLKRVVGVGAAVTVGPWSHAGNSQEPAGRITGFDHVAVPMRDTEAMVAFYRALGFHVNEGEAICSVHVGDHKINFHRPSLWQRKTFALRAPGATPPCGDFCFVWEGTMTALHRSLATVGAPIIEGPSERQGGRDGGRATGTSVYVRDPDQNLVEFIVYS